MKNVSESKKSEVLIAGRTIAELKTMSMATLATIAKIVGKQNGTKVHFNNFHFLDKNSAITLLINGDNSVPESAKIVEEKNRQMEASSRLTGAGIKEWHTEQAKKRQGLIDELIGLFVQELVLSTKPGNEPDLSGVEPKLRKAVYAEYTKAIAAKDTKVAKNKKK